jgi:Protein of unknown function (DUF1236)
MRSKLLISTAALLAGVALASAQNMPGGGRDSGGAQSPAAQGQGSQGGAAAQDRQSPQGERGKQGQAQDRPKQGGQKDQTTGQAPQKEQGAQGRDAQQNKTTGQDDRQQGPSPSGAQRDQSQTQGQTQQRQEGQQGQTGAAPKGPNAPNQAQQKETGGGNVTLTTEQRTKIRQTVLTGNAPRATNVNFSVSVGTVVPTSVRVVAVPTVIVDIHPEWRGYMYFVVDDQIIIVDRNHRIVAVLDV